MASLLQALGNGLSASGTLPAYGSSILRAPLRHAAQGPAPSALGAMTAVYDSSCQALQAAQLFEKHQPDSLHMPMAQYAAAISQEQQRLATQVAQMRNCSMLWDQG